MQRKATGWIVGVGMLAGTLGGAVTTANVTWVGDNPATPGWETVAKTSGVEANIGGMPTDLNIDNADPGAFSVHADATLTLRFFEPAASQPHYGFRWARNHATTLETMRDDGQIVIDDAGLGGPAAIVFVMQGDTYIGVPPPGGSLFLLR